MTIEDDQTPMNAKTALLYGAGFGRSENRKDI